MRDPDSGNSKGFAFINFASFEASDAAIEAMNGQHLCNRAITVSYAFKKDSKGERHGSAAGTDKYVYHISNCLGLRDNCLGLWDIIALALPCIRLCNTYWIVA